MFSQARSNYEDRFITAKQSGDLLNSWIFLDSLSAVPPPPLTNLQEDKSFLGLFNLYSRNNCASPQSVSNCIGTSFLKYQSFKWSHWHHISKKHKSNKETFHDKTFGKNVVLFLHTMHLVYLLPSVVNNSLLGYLLYNITSTIYNIMDIHCIKCIDTNWSLTDGQLRQILAKPQSTMLLLKLGPGEQPEWSEYKS